MGCTVKRGSEMGLRRGSEGGFQKVPRTPPSRVRPLSRAPYVRGNRVRSDERATEVVPGLAKKFGLSPADLLAYVHYFPTFWYFHVHIVCVRHPMFGGDGSKNLLLVAQMSKSLAISSPTR